MIVLSGTEATVLAYLAEYPDAPDVQAQIDQIGPVAKEIALRLTGRGTGHESPEVQEAASSIARWAALKSPWS
ncbi:MAG: hypothetical protein PHT12_01715 [Patescibacteria group bacterium]|nr:hypothetical protein [Patescibacteria group bacterium]